MNCSYLPRNAIALAISCIPVPGGWIAGGDCAGGSYEGEEACGASESEACDCSRAPDERFGAPPAERGERSAARAITSRGCARLHSSILPSSSWKCSSQTREAASSEANVTNPKPRCRPVTRSSSSSHDSTYKLNTMAKLNLHSNNSINWQ